MNIVDQIILGTNEGLSHYSASGFLAGDHSNLIVYGAGEGLIPLERTVLKPLNIKPKILVDKKYHDTHTVADTIYCNIAYLLQNKEILKRYPVIVSLGSFTTASVVIAQLREAGFSRVMWAPDIYEYSLHHGSMSLSEVRAVCSLNKNEIQASYDLLSDKTSKHVFSTVLTRYITAQPLVIPSREFIDQYIGTDVPFTDQISSYICCGAYDGDSIRKMIRSYPTLKTIYAFEPDPDNYKALATYVKQEHRFNSDIQVHCIPCGVYSETTSMSFSASSGLSTTIDPEGTSILPLVALDDFFSSVKVDFVSMDVEGAETSAINGAIELIKKECPTLAISVYHHPEHLWRIAVFLDSLSLGYKFCLRNYSGHTYETVLYAYH